MYTFGFFLWIWWIFDEYLLLNKVKYYLCFIDVLHILI